MSLPFHSEIVFQGAKEAIVAIDFEAAADGSGTLFAGTIKGVVIAWDAYDASRSNEPLHVYPIQKVKSCAQVRSTLAFAHCCARHKAAVRALAVSDGSLYVAVNKSIHVYDVNTEALRFSYFRRDREGLVTNMVVKRGIVYACYTDNCVRVWKDGEWRGSYRGHTGAVLCCRVVGKELYTGSADKTIRLWSLRDAKPFTIWKGSLPQNGPIWALEVVRNLVFFTDAERVLAQVIKTGARQFKLLGHAGEVRRLHYTKHNERLYSGGVDGTVRVWCTRRGDALGVCRGHTLPVNSLVSDDRGLVVSASSDRTLRAWDEGPAKTNKQYAKLPQQPLAAPAHAQQELTPAEAVDTAADDDWDQIDAMLDDFGL